MKKFVPVVIIAAVVLVVAAAGVLLYFHINAPAVVSDATFVASLGEADTLISGGNSRAAIKLLNRLSRGATSTSQRLGLYKRYLNLGAFREAEKCLTVALHKQRDNTDLTAVYVWFLIDRGRLVEAEKHSKMLAGTRYGAVASEVLLRRLLREHPGNAQVLLDALPAESYYDAYVMVKNENLLVNAAALYAAEGHIGKAAALTPETVSTPDKALFWATLLYDARYYGDALDCLRLATAALSPSQTLLLDTMLLQSDVLGLLGDEKSARDTRRAIITIFDEGAVPPVVYYNLVRDAANQQDYRTRFNVLLQLTEQYPDYLPGLLLYADYAFAGVPTAAVTGLEDDLRAYGLQSRLMEMYDTLPRVPPEVALRAIDESYRRTGDIATLVAYQRMRQQAALRFAEIAPPAAGNVVWLWEALERNMGEDSRYPPELVRYAVSVLITYDKVAEARELFERHEAMKEKIAGDSPWELEVRAWFAAADKNAAAAIQLYETLLAGLQTTPDALHEDTLSIAARVKLLLNLAELYGGTARFAKAADLYRNAIELETDSGEKAETLYRLAKLQADQGTVQVAAQTLEYSLSLDPALMKARVLLQKLRQ